MLYALERPAKVLDLGTGTGVLAIAAVQLGAKIAIGVDLNLLAVQTASRNIGLNRFQNRMLAVQGSALELICFDTDLVVANIHYEVMKDLLKTDGFLQKRWFILSGLLRSQAKAIQAQLAMLPATIVKQWNQGGIWYTFLGKAD